MKISRFLFLLYCYNVYIRDLQAPRQVYMHVIGYA